MGSITGIPTKAYPVGEEYLRELRVEYEAAWAKYENGEMEAMKRFYNKNPEYEARLALFKSPEERMRNFLVSELWDKYHELPKLHKDEIAEHLGEFYQTAFINGETRATDDIPVETLQLWLKIMGGDPPGSVTYNEDVSPLALTDPDIAYRMQVFYDARQSLFDYGNYLWPLQSNYFKLDKEARKQYLLEHPEVKYYWDWRDDFMLRNPDLMKYIQDDPTKQPKYESEAALLSAIEAQPQFRWEEWEAVTPYRFMNLMEDFILGDSDLSFVELEELEDIGNQLGLSADEVLERMELAYEAR
jgi:hypothetical protein